VSRVAFLLAALVLALAACGGDDDTETAAAFETTATTEATTTTEEPTTTEEAAPGSSGNGCRTVSQPTPRASGSEKGPKDLLDPDKTYRIAVKTSCGTFTMTLDPKASPRATASFVALARNDFFDNTTFHRIVPGFVIQGGDPSAVGAGGPGYLTVDKPAADTTYTKGVVAMAKSATDPPGTAGSQFFVVTAPDAGLPPDYAVIGHVTEGQPVVDRIGTLGTPTQEGTPTQTVTVDDMVVTVK
jgi:cyclophilin family peptidyl-prolyl cis-trans isomerase